MLNEQLSRDDRRKDEFLATLAHELRNPLAPIRTGLDILRLRSTGIDRSQTDTVLSVLTMDFASGPDGTGTLTLTLAGDGAVRIDVETLSLRLEDVTRPYVAPSGKAPGHD